MVLRGRQTIRLARKRLHFQIDTYDLRAAIVSGEHRALAKLSKAHMGPLAQIQPRGNQDAVNLETRASFELKQDVDQASIVGAAAQNPPSAGEDCTRKNLHESSRFVLRDRVHR